MAGSKLLVYLLRRDLRAADNPLLHQLATSSDHGFTHVLPVYVFPPHQIEVSGFLADGKKSPYPPARSKVGNFWRCGPRRAKFVAESVWDVRNTLEELNNGLVVRIGSYSDVLKHIVESLKEKQQDVSTVWMTEDVSDEEIQDQKSVSSLCAEYGINFELWRDEKYFIDDRDTGLAHPKDLPDVFTTYRKSQEPLRERPRSSLPSPDNLPPLPSWIPPQHSPFIVPESYQELEDRLLQPVKNILPNIPAFPTDAESAHPFQGGESNAWDRLRYLITSGGMTDYKDTRNGLVGPDFSTKLSAYLALGCITARQVHEELLKLEDGTESAYQKAKGYNQGENEGTKAVRFELLWRDYMRLCTMKFGTRLFKLSGFRGERERYDKQWKTVDKSRAAKDQNPSPDDAKVILDRFLEGRTGMGLIDASQRELYHTGYTSNRARQNVASFFSKHLDFDWRYGAEWYEMLLVDYDVSSNWSNWQYVAGVGNDPRGDARIFNPVKQAFDYDNNGVYVRAWVSEVKDLEKLENVFQVWTTCQEDLEKHGLADNPMVTNPVKKIDFSVDRKPRGSRRPYRWRRGGGRGGGNGDRRSSWTENGGGPSPGSTGQQDGGARVGNEGQQRRYSQHHQFNDSHVPRSMMHSPGVYNGNGSNEYSQGYYNGHSNGYVNGHINGHVNGHVNGHINGYSGPGSRGGWGQQGRGNGWRGSGWRGSGRGRGNGNRRGYSNYSYHSHTSQGYIPPPPFPPPMGPSV